MGREVRKVPKNWQHPKNDNGQLIGLLGDSFKEALKDWDEQYKKWKQGLCQSYKDYPNITYVPISDENKQMSFSEYYSCRPIKSEYMPEWKEEEKTHFQMYEICSEGTPISPVMETPEELARWLVDNNASAFGSSGASYEGWLRVCNGGYAPSATMVDGKLESGVDGLTEETKK
jgi:hypothetical protein